MTFLLWALGVIVMAAGLIAVEVHHGLAIALLAVGGVLCIAAGNTLTKGTTAGQARG